MIKAWARGQWLLAFLWVVWAGTPAAAQCPEFSNYNVSGSTNQCGSTITISQDGANIPFGSAVDWYIGMGTGFNPYNGDGIEVGSVPITTETCNNTPQVLYIMVNPDNNQVGGSGDQCDEFLVLWTGSGGFLPNDILVTNLGTGASMWNDFAAGNAATFSCGVALPPGPIPENAILIIQSSPNNNVNINSDALCASGLPVYIITYTGTSNCMFGYFDNNAPCSSCPVHINIDGTQCDWDIDANYTPPGSSVDGWAWANTGAGVYANVIPSLNFPVFDPPANTIPDFNWTVPADFCETYGPGDWNLQGILDPPPGGGCPEIASPYFGVNINCDELIISGGGIVCEGNCPDNPTNVSFEIIGNDVPFTADIVVTVSGFPPFQINDLDIVDGQSIQVCLGGLLPSFDPATGILTVPSLAIGLIGTLEIVSLISNSGCSVFVNPNSVSLTFIDGPEADAGQDQSICSNETVTLSGSISGSAVDAMWETSGDGIFDDPTDVNATYTPGAGDLATGSVTLTLSGSDINNACAPAIDDMIIQIDPALMIQTNTPLVICDNDQATVAALVVGGSVDGLWETTGDGTFADPSSPITTYTPGSSDIINGSVTLSFVPVDPTDCLISNEPLMLSFVAAPLVNIPQNIEICDNDTATFSINVQGDFTTLTWSTAGDGMLMVDNNIDVTYIPGPQDIINQVVIVSVMIQSGFSECGILTYNIPITITDCGCPLLETNAPPGSLCGQIDTLDLNSLLVAGGPGHWMIISTPPGIFPAIINGNNFITSHSDPGNYVVHYILDAPDPGCPDFSAETIQVSEVVVPESGPDQTYCGPMTANISGLYTPFTIIPHFWETLGDGAFGNSSALSTTYRAGAIDSMMPGVQLVFHVIDPVCGDQTDTVTLFYSNAPFATFFNDTLQVCNESTGGSVLNFTASIATGDTNGLWFNLLSVPVDMSNVDSVDFVGIAEGYYTFGYHTSSAMLPCIDSSYTIIVQVKDCDCILLQADDPDGICNTIPDIALNAFVIAGGPGTWQIITSPPGSHPASIVGQTLITSGADAGEYKLRFTLDGGPYIGCPDSVEITLFIQEPPFISIAGDTSSCGVMDASMTATLAGSATGLIWSTSGSGFFTNTNQLSTIYTPSIFDVASAHAFIYATSIDTFGYCPDAKDSVFLFLPTPSSASFNTFVDTICNHPDSNTVINFFSFIIQGDATGLWTDLDGAGVDLTDPGQVDFDGVAPGDYRIMYSTATALAPCVDSSYILTITILDCSCPPLSLDADSVRLCTSSMFDLNGIASSVGPGTWAVTNGQGQQPQINGSIINTNGASGGEFTLTYTLNDSIAGCPASTTLLLQVVDYPAATVIDKICNAAHTHYSVVIETDYLLIADAGRIDYLGNNQFSIDSIPNGQDLTITLNTIWGICESTLTITAPNCDCTLMTEDLVDTLTLCPGDSTRLIPFVTGAMGFPHTYWIQGQDTTEWFSFLVNKAGTYQWVVIDTLGCERRDTFTSVFQGPTAILFQSFNPPCPDDLTGSITLLEVESGKPPYSYELDIGLPGSVSGLPFPISNIGLGSHQLTITDLTGCSLTAAFDLSTNPSGFIELGPDITIAKGDSVFIEPQYAGIGVLNAQWNYAGISGNLDPFSIKPDSSFTLHVIVTDTLGCIYEDELLITVFEKSRFYIANVFSPNGDQVNDELIVNTNLPDDHLISLEIFDRWGNLLFGQYASPPFRWKGIAKDQLANPGVYVYKLIYKDERNVRQTKFGDLTLIR